MEDLEFDPEMLKSVMGTEEQLMTFFEKYENYDRMSGQCALDGRYFWKVLHPYAGLIRSEMYFRINDLGGGNIKISPPAWDCREFFDNKSDARYRLVKIIIDLSSNPDDNNGSVHSNLLYFDFQEKKIVRFEPMFEKDYTEMINELLEGYLEGLLEDYFEGPLPNFKYEMREDHPQLPITEKCPRKGFCAAYTLKAAMLLVNEMEDVRMDRDPRIEEEKIMIFASAIEEEYGIFEDREPEDDEEFGRRRAWMRRGRKGEEMGWGSFIGGGILGLAIGSFINLRRPRYVPVTPVTHPGSPMYSAPYYGYTYGPRYGGRPGWGFNRAGWASYGANGEFGCGCGIRRKIPGPNF